MNALHTLMDRLRRVLARVPPRAAGAVLVCLAVASAAWAVVPRTGGATVLVAAHDLSPGTVLSPDDVRTADYPGELVPAGALTDPAQAAEAVLGGSLAAGTPLTSTSVMEPDAGNRAAGTLLVPTVFGDVQAASAIRPGHRLRVYSAQSGEPVPAAGAGESDEGEVSVPGAAAHAGGALVDDAAVTAVQTQGTGLGQGSTVVTLAVTEADAARLAQAGGSYLSFALLN